jgi:hypothetical protein
LLYRFPEALPIEEINDSFSGLIPVCREMDIYERLKEEKTAIEEALAIPVA